MKCLNLRTCTFALICVLVLSCTENDRLFEKQAHVTRSFTSVDFNYVTYFDSITAKDNWIKYKTHAEMQEALNIPDNLIESLPTEVLISICINYPLWGDVFAYDIINSSEVLSHFNAYKELVNRKSYVESIVNAYKMFNTEVIVNPAKVSNSRGIEFELKEVFFENLFLDKHFLSKVSESTCLELMSLIKERQRKVVYKFATAHKNKIYNQLNKIVENDGFKNDSVSGGNIAVDDEYSPVSLIKTPLGKEVQVIAYPELDKEVLDYYDNYYREKYPLAEVLAPCTGLYNCHYYAWEGISNGKQYWMNIRKTLGEPNVANYWTEDAYSECQNVNYSKVFYGKGDREHSAVYDSSTKQLISKWGSGPLMRHSLYYCPYDASILMFFDSNFKSGLLTASYGQGFTYVGKRDVYSCPTELNALYFLNYEVVIETAKGDSAIDLGLATVDQLSPTSAAVTFHKPGVYEMYIKGISSNGTVVHSYWFEPIVEIDEN